MKNQTSTFTNSNDELDFLRAENKRLNEELIERNFFDGMTKVAIAVFVLFIFVEIVIQFL